MKKDNIKHYASVVVNMGVFPLIFYFIVFCILTYPLILRFSTHFFAGKRDGLQNVWNLWWVNKAVTQLHQSPWRTSYLHYPYGISLLGHTLNPFNGFMGIFLLKSLTLVEAHNFIVVFSFIGGGLTGFWLSYYLTKSYWSSMIAGFIFTFSNYHFAHAEGHLQLVSLEWIPLFVLCWYVLITKPGVIVGIASAIALFAVILCDYYYFLYSVLIGCLMVAWYAIQKKDLCFFLRRKHLVPLVVFIAVVLITTGPLIMSLLLLNMRDPLGGHPSKRYSLDLLAPFIPGGHWRFAHLTQFYWSKLPGNIHESSVHMGISVLFVLIYVWIRRREFQGQAVWLWYFVLIFFFVMGLGPVLHIWGREIPFIRLPYALFEKVFPPLRISGLPVRMMVMVMLSASVICGMGYRMLFQKSAGKRLLAAILLIMLFIEYLPKPMPSSRVSIPGYVKVLKDLPDNKGVIDTVARKQLALYYQTIHEKPMAFGYVSRTPKSVREKDSQLRETIEIKEYIKLCCDYDIRYLITDAATDIASDHLSIEMLYHDSKVKLYYLGTEIECPNGR